MKKLIATATFCHSRLGSKASGEPFECDEALASSLIDNDLAEEVKSAAKASSKTTAAKPVRKTTTKRTAKK